MISLNCKTFFLSYKFQSNGTHTEIEIFGNSVIDKTWLAIGYSADKKMEDDFVVFCIRDDAGTNMNKLDQMAGLAYNGKHSNEMTGTIENIKKNKNDKFGLDLEMKEYEKDEQTLYCKMA